MRRFFDFLLNFALAAVAIGFLVAIARRDGWKWVPAGDADVPAALRGPAKGSVAPAAAPGAAPGGAVAPPPKRPPPPAAAPSAPAAPRGPSAVSGMVAYPGEQGAITETLRVCAVDQETGKERCAARLEYRPDGAVLYRIPLPPGNYMVYASESRGAGAKRAYFTEYGDCFIKRTGCKSTSREAIAVSLDEGQTADGIDPVDWGGHP